MFRIDSIFMAAKDFLKTCSAPFYHHNQFITSGFLGSSQNLNGRRVQVTGLEEGRFSCLVSFYEFFIASAFRE